MSNKENDKEGNTGCFIIIFLVFAAGIPVTLAHTEEGPIGSMVIVIVEIVVAWYVAKALSNN